MSCMSVCVSVRLCSTASYKPHDSNIFVLCVPLCRCYLRLCVFVASTTEIKLRSSIDKYIHFTCIYIILYKCVAVLSFVAWLFQLVHAIL